MKISLLLFVLCSFSTFAQKKTEIYKFEDGTEIELTRYFNNPLKVPKFSIAANYSEIFLNGAASGITIVPEYRLSDEMFIDAHLFFSALRDGNSPREEEFLEAARSTFNFSTQVHYELVSSSKPKETGVSVKYQSGSFEDTRYVVNLPILYKRALLLDGGLNYSQFSVNNIFDSDQPVQYSLIGQSALSFMFGLSYYKSSHHKLKIEDKKVRNYRRETRLSLGLLLGAPMSSNVVSFVDTVGLIEAVNFTPSASDFEKPVFYNLGLRLNFDSKRGFARRPNVFFNWGAGIGLEPSYSVVDFGSPQGDRALYGMIKLGFGFGKF